MSAFTNFSEEQLTEFVLSGVALTIPATSGNWWVALHTSDPGDAPTSTSEPSTSVWTNYVRQAIPRSTAATAWSTAASEAGGGLRKANSTTVNFGTASLTSDISVNHVSLWASSSAGNCWFQGALSTTKTIQNNDPVTFPSTTLGIAFR